MFKVGQKVVCIEGFERCIEKAKIFNTILPIKGNIYTVRNVINYPYGVFLTFKEIFNPVLINGLEADFDAACFRAMSESFADEVIERIKEQIKEEELVTI